MSRSPSPVFVMLGHGLSRMESSLYGNLLKQVARDFESWRDKAVPVTSTIELQLLMAEYLVESINREKEELSRLESLADEFGTRISQADTRPEEREQTLEFARRLGASARDLRKDDKGFGRWFGFDAVLERCTRRMDGVCFRLSFLLPRLGSVMAGALSRENDPELQTRYWQRIDPEKVVRMFFAFQRDERVNMAAFRSLSLAVSALTDTVRSRVIHENSLRFVYRSALEISQPIWLQCEALKLLGRIDPPALARVLQERLTSPATGDDFFVRRRCVLLLETHAGHVENVHTLLRGCRKDPSVYVRQALSVVVCRLLLAERAAAIGRKQGMAVLARLILKDPAPQVRGQGVLALVDLFAASELFNLGNRLLERVLKDEKNPFVLRAALHVCSQAMECLEQEQSAAFYRQILPGMSTLRDTCEDLRVRRWAARIMERVRLGVDPDMQSLVNRLEFLVRTVPPGKSKWFRVKKLGSPHPEDLGRALSILAQDGFSLGARRTLFGWRIYRGDRFGFRFWRLFHELRNPSPDKRQAHSHTIGRIDKANISAPSSVLAELTRTKVPGEPLYVSEEDGWRPYLPLPDQVLSFLKDKPGSGPTLIFTPQGVTTLNPSGGFLRRLLGVFRITWSFDRLASLRTWTPSSGRDPKEYVRKLRKLGVDTRFRPYQGEDASISRFFAFSIPLGSGWWDRFVEYFFSVYRNSLYELGIFAAGLGTFFAARIVVLSRRVIQARKQLTLVVGGWGTRGKSGVERLKAALFESQGHAMVSKTTGSEAMFLYAHDFGKTREMFLFRPYDKATIWEQTELMRLAVRLKSRVFLWECMALTPSYVRILQHHWSRDSIATITNAYPDHEDIQGPAGYNIPHAMNEFIPERSILVTTEEQMLPILEEGARERKTGFVTAGWIEVGLLPPEILSRFPYEEHPYNIALVATMAGMLGLEEDVALKEMADRVVPDIGVLKGFPPAPVRGRRLEFVNGMAANERFATLSNWERMDFAEQEMDGSTCLVALVNNRADRISRSRMFASILVEDVGPDRIVLIGSNLKGLKGYINESLEPWLAGLSLDPARNQDRSPREVLDDLAKRLRIPVSEEMVQTMLKTMLTGLALDGASCLEVWDSPDRVRKRLEQEKVEGEKIEEVVGFLGRYIRGFREYETLVGRLDNKDFASLDKELRTWAETWFREKIAVIDDVHADGEKILSRFIPCVPPGFLVRIMGMQNIKGPGLDFVYRWQAWERCHASLIELEDEAPAIMEQGLKALMGFQEWGVLSHESVLEVVDRVGKRPEAQNESFQAGLALIRSSQEKSSIAIAKRVRGRQRVGLLDKVFSVVESFLDAGDAVRRRKKANRIYKDMVDERISTERAAVELKKLNKRQKGGWLKEKWG